MNNYYRITFPSMFSPTIEDECRVPPSQYCIQSHPITLLHGPDIEATCLSNTTKINHKTSAYTMTRTLILVQLFYKVANNASLHASKGTGTA